MFRTAVVLAFSATGATGFQATRGYGDATSFGMSGNGREKAANREDNTFGAGDLGFPSVRE
jgi:hypothetical protein